MKTRKGTFDKAIYESVYRRREYGRIDFRGKTVIDIGAHIGSFSKLAARLGAAKVLAFEANPENFALLKYNCAKYRAVVSFHQRAVWRSDEPVETLTWEASDDAYNTGGGGVYEKHAAVMPPIIVQAQAFDDILAGLERVDVLKTDCEGSEYPILFTSKMLSKVRLIVGEWHRLPTREQIPENWTPEGLLEHLRVEGFKAEFYGHQGDKYGLFRAVRP